MEFMHVARHATNGGNNLDLLIQQGIKSRPDNVINGLDDEVTLDDDESSILRDRLLPLIIGLLRTAKLPSVLRIYRDTLISDMKTSIKSTVAELLPVLVSRPLDIDSTVSERQLDTDGGSLSLASKLRSLSPKNFVLLLIAIFNVVQAHLVRAAEVKRVIEWIMGNLDGCDAADSVAAAVALGAAAAAAAESSQETDVQIITSLTNSFPKNTSRVSSVHMKINKASSPTTTTNFRTDVLRENTEAVFSACDAAHGRWAKLLGVRALIHPKLRLQEFLSIYNITQDFITTTEKIGGRLGYSIRGTLQSQSKSFVDFQHDFGITKIKAILDQETWVLVDVPKEFQNIIDSLSSLVLFNVHDSRVEVGFPGNDSVESSIVSIGPVIESSMDSEVKVNNNNNSNGIASGHGKSASQTIVYKGVGYHMVNCGLIMVKMLSEYIDICKFLPTLSSEVVHRVVEFLKVFNTRTCQLVLGAGAMQVSGLKSITSKHLALASQITSFIYTIIPDIRKVLFLKIPESRRGLLLFEIDRVAQDYKVHRDEIHSKLVQIMRERLLANLRKLPQIVETWNNPEDNEPQPSQFARSVTKEVSYLHRILSQILLETDVKIIFRQVVQIFHSHISEAFSNIEIKSQQAKIRLHRDVQHILGCIRKLPSDDSDGAQLSNQGLLDEFLTSKIGKIES